MIRRKAWFWILMWVISAAYAQQDTLIPGLVLSGGGAKGYAHIGVLKVLEENGLIPAHVSGTSIGAIIGAYYAAGYTADEIKRKFRDMDMKRIMQDKLPRRYLPLYEKKWGRDNFFYFPVDKRKLSVHLPQGLTNYQLFYNRLFKDLFVIQYASHFDSLPVKLRFYATDLVNGRPVVFRSGSVPRAVVASSAFPSIVAPLKIDGKLLSDGGILNNYPLDGVKETGANYVIGVDVQGRLLREDELRGISDILDQITGFYMYAHMPEKKRMTDIYIRPRVENFKVTDFDVLDTAYVLGRLAAKQYAEQFKKLAARSRKPHRPRPGIPDTLVFKKIEIRPSGKFNQEQILWRANLAENKKMAFRDFETGINYLYGTGDYKQIHYWLTPDSTLVMDIMRDTVDLKLKLAYQYTPLYKINLLAGIVYRNFFHNRGLIDMEFILGDPLRYNLHLLFDNGYHFGYGLSSSLHQFDRKVSYPLFFSDVVRPSFRRMDLHYARLRNRLYFLTLLSTDFNMTLGGEYDMYRLYTTVFSPSSDEKKYYLSRDAYLSPFFDLYYDDMDDFYFPSHGVVINLRTAYYWHLNPSQSGKGFYKLDFDLTGARKHSRHFSTSYRVRTGLLTTVSDVLPLMYFFGGIEHKNPVDNLIAFYSRDYMAVKSPAYVMVQPQIQKQIQNHYFQLGMQALVWEEIRKTRLESLDWAYNVYFRYGLKSFFGPVFATFGYEPATRHYRFNFTVGFFF